MEIEKGDIVRAQNGRDKGKALFVLAVEGAYLILIDGKSRKIEHPKRKKEKHCMFQTRTGYRVSEKIRTGERVLNSEVRRALAAFTAGNAEKGAEDEGGLEIGER